jgi:hypothetical protein
MDHVTENFATLPPGAVVTAGAYVLLWFVRLFAPSWVAPSTDGRTNQLVRVGLLVVHVPMFVLILAMPTFWIALNGYDLRALFGVIAGIVFAGLWRSLVAPRWRLWAYRSAGNSGSLFHRGLWTSVILPQRHWLSALELAPPALKEREKALAASLPPDSLFRLTTGAYEVGAWAGSLAVSYRIFGGGILAFFAYVPLFIAWGILKQLIEKPSDTDWLAVTVISGCLAVAYFLLLLAYRAFTGRGRKKDDALLPPWALMAFAGLFCAVGWAVVVLGLMHRDWHVVRGGLIYCVTSSAVVLAAYRRRRRVDVNHAQ